MYVYPIIIILAIRFIGLLVTRRLAITRFYWSGLENDPWERRSVMHSWSILKPEWLRNTYRGLKSHLTYPACNSSSTTLGRWALARKLA